MNNVLNLDNSWQDTLKWANVSNSPNNNNNTLSTSNDNNNSFITSNNQPNEPKIEMIKKLYHIILGREADTAGLNYFLYSNLNEYEIAKEMYESTEHADMLQKAKDVREVLKRYEELIKKNSELEKEITFLKELIENYKAILSRSDNNSNPSNKPSEQPEQIENLPNQNYVEYQQEEIVLKDPFDNGFFDDKSHPTNKNSLISLIKDWIKF